MRVGIDGIEASLKELPPQITIPLFAIYAFGQNLLLGNLYDQVVIGAPLFGNPLGAV